MQGQLRLASLGVSPWHLKTLVIAGLAVLVLGLTYTRVYPGLVIVKATGDGRIGSRFSAAGASTASEGRPDAAAGAPSPGFLVKTSGCSLPDVDHWDSSLDKIVSKGKPVQCPKKPNVVLVKETMLVIDRDISKKHYGGKVDYCQYENITRALEARDDTASVSSPSAPFKTEVPVSADFVRVICFDAKKAEVYRNYHPVIQRKPDVEKKLEELFEKHNKANPGEKLNVILLGVDSVSRLNFMRQMPETRQFLLEEMNAVEMSGYNKIADNTFVNIVPMFTGKFLEELPWNETLSHTPFDKYQLFWKDFAAKGYRTLFAEDAPKIAIFNYVKYGFHHQPTDYYLRPFSLAMERDTSGHLWSGGNHCVGNKLETDVVLDWLKDYMKEFWSDPYFAFSFITRLSHDSIASAGAADIPYRRFFKDIHDKKLLNNTVLFFFSDHGIRFGSIRSTYIGKLEERLPFMFMVFPPWFLEKYPQIEQNLRNNTNRLSTPFDIYSTVQNLLNFNGAPNPPASVKSRGNTLLDLIPEERTCDDAGILPHWCTCQRQVKIPNTDKRGLHGAEIVVDYINKQLKAHSQCAQLKLSKIQDVRKAEASDQVLKFLNSKNDVLNRKVSFGNSVSSFYDYLLTFFVSPSHGLFEATVRFTEQTEQFTIQGDISRINMYGNQSVCIDNFVLKKFCYCV